MTRYFLAAVALSVASTAALAQSADRSGQTPAVSTAKTVNPDAPVKGANSFTKDQAISRIAAQGFTDVSGLMKDKDGVWRGKAIKQGATMDVAVDYQGNVTAQ